MSEKVAARDARILDAGLDLAAAMGWRRYNRREVAARAGVAHGSVNNAFGTMDALHDAVMVAAVERNVAKVVAEGLACRHPAALAAPMAIKDAALAALA